MNGLMGFEDRGEVERVALHERDVGFGGQLLRRGGGGVAG